VRAEVSKEENKEESTEKSKEKSKEESKKSTYQSDEKSTDVPTTCRSLTARSSLSILAKRNTRKILAILASGLCSCFHISRIRSNGIVLSASHRK